MERDATSRSTVLATAIPGLVSALLLWLAFPPCGWWYLGWIAPCGWLWLVRQPAWTTRRPYFWMYLSGAAFWLPYLQGIRLAHWALIFGWLVLALYLAFYSPLFVGLARILVHRCRMPLPFAGAITWTGLEFVRAYFATGFGGGMLAHSQTPVTSLIQTAEYCGTYGLTFLMVFVAGGVVEAVDAQAVREPRCLRRSLGWLGAALLLVCGNWVWGQRQIDHYERREAAAKTEDGDTAIHVALIQESVDTIFEYDPQRSQETFAKYRRATLNACRENPHLDLVVWPESVFTADTPDYLGGDPRHPELRKRRAAFEDKVAWLAREINDRDDQALGKSSTWLLVGTVTVDLASQPPKEYNSALLISPSGEVVGRYFKNHLVMFGEYIPGGSWLPWLYRVTPMPNGLAAGQGPEAFAIRGVRLSPSICFESMVPHLINRQVNALKGAGTPPDVLVNVTNDGWFWGSSILDTHFQAAMFRAIEHRRPLLVAANTGLSCVIAPTGRVLARGQHREAAVLLATVSPATTADTPFQSKGNLLATSCIIVGIGAVTLTFISRRRVGRSLHQAEH